jgi:hypothetical protein
MGVKSSAGELIWIGGGVRIPSCVSRIWSGYPRYRAGFHLISYSSGLGGFQNRIEILAVIDYIPPDETDV